jgi:parallel beta-helix repeat protein
VNWRRSTGGATDSVFHHNFFGAYSYQARGLVFRGNVFRDNKLYGLDPHTGSTRLVVERNQAFRNGAHGIVFSEDVTDGVVRGNRSFANGDNGIVLDERSDRNLVSGNLVEGNQGDGIVILGSSDNLVRGNVVRGNRVGIEVRAPARLRGDHRGRGRPGDRRHRTGHRRRRRRHRARRHRRGRGPAGRARPGPDLLDRVAEPLAGAPPRAVLANRLTVPSGPVPWLALVGVAYLVVAIALQLLHLSRNRAERRLREVPWGVAKW